MMCIHSEVMPMAAMRMAKTTTKKTQRLGMELPDAGDVSDTCKKMRSMKTYLC
jgi:hypothetical protein